MTDPDRRRRVEDVCDAALNRDVRERTAFVAAECGRDEALRIEVEALLVHAQTAEGFLAAPIGAVAAHVLGDESVASLVGRQVGAYQIVSRLGTGGMGEVYRARDTTLGRDVAIKVLPKSFTSDPERRARFEREARMLAALNHPHIGAIYGLEDVDGVRALVLELVEGPTLADVIAGHRSPEAESLRSRPRGSEAAAPRGGGAPRAMKMNDALAIARQIAEALEAAHEKEIVHRDLKPANVKITPAGVVKVLDFGLAKAAAGDSSAPELRQSPTITIGGTHEGMILGTAAYMSPEQARGQAVDKRADIWAFGCVLYEVLTGCAPFPGDTASDTIAAILEREPRWEALPSGTPPAIRRLVRRCLEKDRQERLHDIADARLEIKEALTAPDAVVIPRAVPLWRRALPGTLASVLLVGLGLLSFIHFRETPPPRAAPEMRLEIVTPATSDPISFALSPDGRQLVFVASGDGPSRLWLRPLAATAAQPLAGTEGAAYPFWSPDSRSVGFFADAKLKRLDIGGGSPQTLADASPRGGTWNADGVILFAQTTNGPLFRIPASGGEAVAVTQGSHRFPQFLPDGRQFLFYALGTPDTSGVYLGSLDSGETKRLTPADTAGLYAPSGWLVWVRASTLVAQHLDLEQRALAGDPVTVAALVGFEDTVNAGAFSVSAGGLMAYRPGGPSRRQLRWFDRAGKALGALGTPDEMRLSMPRVSPDGRRVVVYRTVQGNSDLWLLDGTRMSRFTFDAALDRFPVWSPDGSLIVFDSNRTGVRNLYVKPASGAGSEELLVESPHDEVAADWSPDGRFLLYSRLDPPYGPWVLPLEGDRPSTQRRPWLFLKTAGPGQFSPDGRWVAYASNESGRVEIYVRPFVDPAAPTAPDRATGDRTGGQWQVSTAGGISPRWRPDGKELYYIGPDGQIMAASITATGTTPEPGTPAALLHARIYGGGASSGQGRQYDVTRDGRFLINTVLDDAVAPITLLLNWTAGLKK